MRWTCGEAQRECWVVWQSEARRGVLSKRGRGRAVWPRVHGLRRDVSFCRAGAGLCAIRGLCVFSLLAPHAAGELTEDNGLTAAGSRHALL